MGFAAQGYQLISVQPSRFEFLLYSNTMFGAALRSPPSKINYLPHRRALNLLMRGFAHFRFLWSVDLHSADLGGA